MRMFIIRQWKLNKIVRFRTLTLKKKKNTDKSVLRAICPDQVKKKIIICNLTTRNYGSIICLYQLKTIFF